jgi:hypothetical protein
MANCAPGSDSRAMAVCNTMKDASRQIWNIVMYKRRERLSMELIGKTVWNVWNAMAGMSSATEARDRHDTKEGGRGGRDCERMMGHWRRRHVSADARGGGPTAVGSGATSLKGDAWPSTAAAA